MSTTILGLLLTFLFTSATHATSKLRVVTTLPDLAEIARDIGGDQVEVSSLLTGREDAHFQDALPTFIRLVANADIVCSMGLDLEVGWLPKVLTRSGNAKVQVGGVGHCEAGKTVTVIEKAHGPVDRSMGHVHPAGNPHFNLSPKALSEAAISITNTLSAARPNSSAAFSDRLKTFQARMTSLHARIFTKLQPAVAHSRRHPVAIEYHKEFTYFLETYGLRSIGSIEEKPGVPPSAARLARIASASREANVRVALVANYNSDQHARRFGALSGIPVEKLPTAVQAKGETDSIEKLQDAIARAVLKHFPATNPKQL